MAWRPLPGAPAAPVRVGDTLDGVLARLGTPSRAGVEVVFGRWDEVVGTGMADRTRPASIDGDALVVVCDDPALTTHVRFLEAQLVARIAELSGDGRITRVVVRVDRRGRGGRAPRPPGRRRGDGASAARPSSGSSHPSGRLYPS